MLRAALASAVLCLMALLLATAASHGLPRLDLYADRYFKDTTADAALAYATTRGVNAVVSVLKESYLDISPAGVGLNIAAGQILDPIDDMTERLASVLVTALVSLGLQKLLMEIGRLVPFTWIALVPLLFLLPLWFKTAVRTSFIVWLMKMATVLLALRLLLPLSSLINDSLYHQLLKDEMIAAKNQLATISTHRQSVGGFSLPDEESGLLASVSKNVKEQMAHAREAYQGIAEKSDDIIDALLRLTILYVSLFILQVIFIPLVMLWLMVLCINALFKPLQGGLPTDPLLFGARRSIPPAGRNAGTTTVADRLTPGGGGVAQQKEGNDG